MSWRASATVSNTRARSRTMSAPDAAGPAAGLGQPSRGATRRRSVRPKLSIARAALPIFSPSWGRTRTMAGCGAVMLRRLANGRREDQPRWLGPQGEALELACRGLRQRRDELNVAGIFVRGDGRLDVVLEGAGEGGTRVVAGGGDDEGLHPLAALLAGHADHRAFEHGGVGVEGVLHLRRGDVVARRDDHVVRPGDVPEIAVLILAVGVAGEVPAILDIGGLAGVVEIAAAGGAFHRQLAGRG